MPRVLLHALSLLLTPFPRYAPGEPVLVLQDSVSTPMTLRGSSRHTLLCFLLAGAR